jgi:two-component system response regulator PhoP
VRILVVEDEPVLRGQLAEQLERAGYRVDQTGDGREGLYLAEEYPFDAAIVDLGLPGLPGLELVRRLRARGSPLPILILTARDRWQDKVEGLEAGGDDYLAKPFHAEELVARLRALLRRAAGAADGQVQGGPIVLDPRTQKVTRDGEPVSLTSYEFRLLEYLMTHRARVVPKDELADYLYPLDESRDSNVVEVLLARLRRKLDPTGTLAPIETVRGRGYRFRLERG